jgi:hypothetical protein
MFEPVQLNIAIQRQSMSSDISLTVNSCVINVTNPNHEKQELHLTYIIEMWLNQCSIIMIITYCTYLLIIDPSSCMRHTF